MNRRTAGLVALATASVVSCNAFEESTQHPRDAIEAETTLLSMMVVTRGIPVHIRPLTVAEIQAPRNFIEVELTQNDNPEKVPVYFELFLQRLGEPVTFLGTFAPYPPDNVGVYLIGLTDGFQIGDSLELRLLAVDPEQPGDVRIAFAPIRMIENRRRAIDGVGRD